MTKDLTSPRQFRDLSPFFTRIAGKIGSGEEHRLMKKQRLLEKLIKSKYLMILASILGALLGGRILYLLIAQDRFNSLLARDSVYPTEVILGAGGVLAAGLGLFGLFTFQQVKQLGRQQLDMEKANALLKKKVNDLTVELANTLKQLNLETDQRRRLVAQLKEQTTTDSITGLLNRGAGMALLVNQLHMAERYQWPLTVWSINIDNLKQVKDKFGYEAGDQMIQEISRIIHANIRESDTVFRMGEYELMVILPQCPLSEASGIRDRMIKSVRFDRHLSQYDWQAVICDGFAEHQLGSRMRVTDLVQQAGQNAYQDMGHKQESIPRAIS